MYKARDAIRLFKRALELRPSFAQALVNWGNALRDGGDFEGARMRYREALAADPGAVQAMVSHASALLEEGRLAEARDLYAQALAAQPASPDAQAGMAQVELRERRFAEGWDHYERRFDTTPPSARRRSMAMPLLTGENVDRAKRVAVWMEQGVGDQVLFSTLLPALAARGVEPLVEVDPRLAGLFARGLPGIRFATPEAFASEAGACDHHVALGSLPRILRRDAADFAHQPRAVLAADPARVRAFREALGGAPAIAIAWRSIHKGAKRIQGERKSIPLEHFAALARATGARLVDLQYGDVAEERRAFESRHPGVLLRLEGLDPFSDLEGVAAALVACGRAVTSSNVTAHLAGALGVPTQLLYLNGWAPFSYWVPGPDGRSPWYPSVQVPGAAWKSWEEAFSDAARSGTSR